MIDMWQKNLIDETFRNYVKELTERIKTLASILLRFERGAGNTTCLLEGLKKTKEAGKNPIVIVDRVASEDFWKKKFGIDAVSYKPQERLLDKIGERKDPIVFDHFALSSIGSEILVLLKAVESFLNVR